MAEDSTIEQQIVSGSRLLTCDELAKRLGLSEKNGPRTVREKVRAGSLPAIRLSSRTIRFHWPTVMEAITKVAQE